MNTKKLLIFSLILNALFIGATIFSVMSLRVKPIMPQQLLQERRLTIFEELPNKTGQIVLLGDSLTDRGLWSELFPDQFIINRGINGDKTADILARLPHIIELIPRKLFILMAINDLSTDIPFHHTEANIKTILSTIKQQLPDTKVYVQSVLPTNSNWWQNIDPKDIANINQVLHTETTANGFRFLDIQDAFKDAEGFLRKDLSNDGGHLLGKGYIVWRDQISSAIAE